MDNKLAPTAIEEMISQHPLVEACIVVGEDQLFYGVIIAPNKVNLAQKLQEEQPQSRYNIAAYRGLNHIDIRSYYCDLLETLNKELTGKRIERFALLHWEAGKSRAEICAENHIIIDSFYQEYIPGIG